MIEHDQTILRFADHVIHLENGKLVENKLKKAERIILLSALVKVLMFF